MNVEFWGCNLEILQLFLPPVYMVPGDVVEVDIGLLGVLKNPIVAAPKL